MPWPTIDMDFMNLNQAAHGDREFGFMQTRLRRPRKTVAGTSATPASWRGSVAGSRGGDGLPELRTFGSPASVTTCAMSP